MKKLLNAVLLMLCMGCLVACSNQSKDQEKENSSLRAENASLKQKAEDGSSIAENASSRQSSSTTSFSTARSDSSSVDEAQIDLNNMDLHQFVNKYGMSPALYKTQHYGMSEKEALDSTPDSMKTSGEIQTQHQLDAQ